MKCDLLEVGSELDPEITSAVSFVREIEKKGEGEKSLTNSMT